MINMALRKDGNSKNSASYKPYDPNNSFVKKMTNTVTGLLRWRSNLQSESQHVNTAMSSKSEDDSIAPAAKRMKVQNEEDKSLCFISNTGKDLQDACSPIKPVNDIHAGGPSNRNKCIISSTPAVTSHRPPVFSVTLDQSSNKRVTLNADNSEVADISSSLPTFSVYQRHNITVPSLSKDVPNMMSTVDANKSLTGSFSSTNSRRPSFNVDVFSSSSRRLSLSVCEGKNRSCLSPFYSARTMYGGASALLPYGSQTTSRMRSASTSKLDVFSPRSQITMQPVPSPNKLNDQEILSASARRILDSLEKYCSPVADAKRIPVNESSRKSVENMPHSLNRGVKRKLLTLNQMLPSTSELLRIKRTEKIQDSISSAKQTVSTVPESSIAAEDSDTSSDSAELDYSMMSQESKDIGSQYVGKLTRKNDYKFDDRPKPVNLPNAVLKISNLPKFDVTDEFVFSKPLLLENLDEKVEESTSDSVTKNNKSTQSPSANLVLSASVSTSNTVSNVPETTVFPTYSTSLLKNTTPILKLPSTPETIDNSSSTASKLLLNDTTSAKGGNSSSLLKGTNWTCMKCFTMNVADECSKCSQPRPQKVESVVSTESSVDSKKVDNSIAKAPALAADWGNKFKPPADTWECPECLVRNQNTSTECVACGKVKNNVPNSSATAASLPVTAISKSSGFDWKNLEKPTGWSCSYCYVQNKDTDSKCAACEQARETWKNDVTASKEPSKLPQFSFGIDKGGVSHSFGQVNSSKLTISDKPAGSISFGTPSISTAVSTPATFTFGIKSNSQSTNSANDTTPTAVSNGENNTVTTASMATFTFGLPKSTASETNPSNVPSSFKNPLPNSPQVFGPLGGSEKPTEKKESSSIFNDVSSTSNSKNPLLANDSAIFKTPKLTAPKPLVANSKENGGGGNNLTSTNIFNSISSSTEVPKKKVTMFSSVLNNEPSSGLASKNDTTVTNGGANIVSSSSNMFVTSMSTSAFTPATSKLTNDTHLSFATAAAATSKTEPPTFGDRSGSSVKLFGSQANSFANAAATSLTSTPLLFGNSGVGNATTSILGGGSANTAAAAAAAAVRSSETPSLNAVAGGPTAPAFSAVTPAFSFGANANANASSAAPVSLKSSEMSLPNNPAPPPSFASVAAPQPSVFSFGTNAAAGPPATGAAATQPSAGGGFMFNGPKAEDGSASKFRFGAVNTTPFGGAPTGAGVGASSPFTFGSATSAVNATVADPNERSTNNMLFGGVAVANKVAAAETAPVNANSVTAFGSNVFNAASSQPTNPAKKSGGFNFNAASSSFTSPTVNNFTNFTNAAAANQEPKPGASTFVFGSTPNQALQTHNFNPTLPPSFNFSGGNQMMSFSAQPTTASATPNACGPTRKIKKAVRRTTQK